jgi:CRISPR/Cas system endoribonuclease Cas6 (RAMP superfamily)
MFKHFSSQQRIPFINPPFIPERRQRGHQYRYSMESATHHSFPPRYSFLTNRIASRWNSLPDHVVNASTVAKFKLEYDRLKF